MASAENLIRVPAFMILTWAMALPASAQVLKPELTQAPCTDPHNCPNYKRGAALDPPGAAQAQKTPCPSGTVYNPKRGTCKVVGSP